MPPVVNAADAVLTLRDVAVIIGAVIGLVLHIVQHLTARGQKHTISNTLNAYGLQIALLEQSHRNIERQVHGSEEDIDDLFETVTRVDKNVVKLLSAKGIEPEPENDRSSKTTHRRRAETQINH